MTAHCPHPLETYPWGVIHCGEPVVAGGSLCVEHAAVEAGAAMSADRQPLTHEAAESIYWILREEVGAPERWHDYFVHSQTTRFVPEFRFSGSLGFGGKFWRNPGFLPDGSWGERWYVNYYNEDATEERDAAMQRANERLGRLRAVVFA